MWTATFDQWGYRVSNITVHLFVELLDMPATEVRLHATLDGRVIPDRRAGAVLAPLDVAFIMVGVE